MACLFPDPVGAQVNDVKAILAIVNHLDKGLCLDRSRSMVTGHSNGGMVRHG